MCLGRLVFCGINPSTSFQELRWFNRYLLSHCPVAGVSNVYILSHLVISYTLMSLNFCLREEPWFSLILVDKDKQSNNPVFFLPLGEYYVSK